MIRAVYPGTFDPLTRGHEDLVRRASKLFDPLIVGVADSKAKRTFFTLHERVRDGARGARRPEERAGRRLQRPADRFRARARRARGAAGPARGVGFRVRVPAGRHEPQPVPGFRDHVPHAFRAAHVHLGDAGARDRRCSAATSRKFVHPLVRREARRQGQIARAAPSAGSSGRSRSSAGPARCAAPACRSRGRAAPRGRRPR